MAETRKLAAILAADVAGYSKLAAADEERTLARLRALRSNLFDPTIALHHGRVVKRTEGRSELAVASCDDISPGCPKSGFLTSPISRVFQQYPPPMEIGARLDLSWLFGEGNAALSDFCIEHINGSNVLIDDRLVDERP